MFDFVVADDGTFYQCFGLGRQYLAIIRIYVPANNEQTISFPCLLMYQ